MCRRKPRSQCVVIVYLTIEDDMHSSIFIGDGLRASRHIDHTQPTHSQSYFFADMMPFIVRAAMSDCGAHCGQCCLAFGGVSRPSGVSGYPAHQDTTRCWRGTSAPAVRDGCIGRTVLCPGNSALSTRAVE